MKARSAFGQRTLPGEYFTSPEIYSTERERIFGRSWLLAGHASELARTGNYFLCELDRESVLVLCDADGKVGAFHNVCRHRGSRLCTAPRGELGHAIQCPYHAWTYGLDGALRAAPNMADVAGFERADYPLRPVAVDTWEGFVFVNLVNKLLESAIAGKAPDIDVTDDDGIVNKIWRVDDKQTLSGVIESMSDKSLFIADGHHRYETALNYRNMMREKAGNFTGEEPFNFIMMYFSNMDDEGMTIWPTHRVVHSLKNFDADSFLASCKEYFDLREFAYTSSNEPSVRATFLKELEKSGEKAVSMGLHIRARNIYYLLSMYRNIVGDFFHG